jgi:hypothetical protein
MTEDNFSDKELPTSYIASYPYICCITLHQGANSHFIADMHYATNNDYESTLNATIKCSAQNQMGSLVSIVLSHEQYPNSTVDKRACQRCISPFYQLTDQTVFSN